MVLVLLFVCLQKVNLFAHIRRKHNLQVPTRKSSLPSRMMHFAQVPGASTQYPKITSQLASAAASFNAFTKEFSLAALKEQLEIQVLPSVPKWYLFFVGLFWF